MNKEFEAWYVDITGNTVCSEEDAFYDMINYFDFIFDQLMRLEKKVERINEILATSDDEDEDEDGEYEVEYDDLDCDGDE